MELTRTIHPVGQGGFYTESLKDDNDKEFMVVYDCGGNNMQFMEDYLKSFIHKSPSGDKIVIDAVFISHLHADHINGLKYLLDNAYVKYLFLPQINYDMLIEVILYNNLHINLRDYQYLTNFILSISEDQSRYGETRIVQVHPATNDDRIDVEGDGNAIYLDNNTNVPNPLRAGTKISFSTTPKWLYIPYNPPVCQDKAGSFPEFLKLSLGITSLNPIEMPDIVKTYGIDNLRKLYMNYFRNNHNSYSMTLFSGLRKPDCYHFDLYHRRHKKYRWCDCDYCRYRKIHETPNCLYTGDFESLKYVSNLHSYYNDLWDTITSIQVPHHGSRNNYHPDLYDYTYRGFVSAGTRNRYHHPNIDTLINIHHEGCRPIVVTDDLSTMYVDYYKL